VRLLKFARSEMAARAFVQDEWMFRIEGLGLPERVQGLLFAPLRRQLLCRAHQGD
jgi:hypothetical protein